LTAGVVISLPLVDLADRTLVLASGSPRRRELLALLGVEFDVVPADVDESPLLGEVPSDMVIRLAEAKATTVAVDRPTTSIVIGSDTIVDVDGEILGKPVDEADARRMLRLLSGRVHRVHSAVAVVDGGTCSTGVSTTDVTFAEMTDGEIDWYVATGEPLDKAGAYGLQGAAGIFVRSVSGSVSGVLGLPLDVVTALLAGVSA